MKRKDKSCIHEREIVKKTKQKGVGLTKECLLVKRLLKFAGKQNTEIY